MRILLTHTPADFANYYGEEAFAALQAHGEVKRHQGDTSLDEAALIIAARDCDVIVADRQTPGPAGVFAALPGLMAFLRVAVDIRNIDVEAASAQGVLVCRATPGFADSVAELAIGMLIDLARGMSDAVLAYRAGAQPSIRRGRQLAGSSIGIIGMGVIGRRVAAIAQGMGMVVLASDPAVSGEEAGVEMLGLTEMLGRADAVICLAPATPQTENLMNAERFASMRPSSLFLNLSRGNLVDEAALEAALASGHLAGAAMDVGRAPDQMPSPRLAARADVIATPHIGGLTPQATAHQAFDTVRQVAALAAGQMPDGAVNASQASRLAKRARQG